MSDTRRSKLPDTTIKLERCSSEVEIYKAPHFGEHTVESGRQPISIWFTEDSMTWAQPVSDKTGKNDSEAVVLVICFPLQPEESDHKSALKMTRKHILTT